MVECDGEGGELVEEAQAQEEWRRSIFASGSKRVGRDARKAERAFGAEHGDDADVGGKNGDGDIPAAEENAESVATSDDHAKAVAVAV